MSELKKDVEEEDIAKKEIHCGTPSSFLF